jgi:hypothetical protein
VNNDPVVESLPAGAPRTTGPPNRRRTRWRDPYRLLVAALGAGSLGCFTAAALAAPVTTPDVMQVHVRGNVMLFANDVGAGSLVAINGQPLVNGQISTTTARGTLRCSSSGYCDFLASYPLNPGSDVVTYTATDGTATADGSLAIEATNQAPEWEIDPLQPLQAIPGSRIRFSARDPEGDPVAYTVVTPATAGFVECFDRSWCRYSLAADAAAPGTDTFTIEARDTRGGVTATSFTVDIQPDPANPVAGPPLSSKGKMSVVYDFAGNAQVLFNGDGATPGLSSTTRSFRQFPLGTPFPLERWLGKVGHLELKGKSPAAMAALMRSRMSKAKIGHDIDSGFVAIDEVGVDLDDRASGPALLEAMRILSRSRHATTGEPLSRRVIFYAAPKMVANVGSGHDRDQWDSALAAARLSGGVFLQMYHAQGGRVTNVFSAQEWRDYLPVWAQTVPASRLHVLLSSDGRVTQDEQWRRARQAPSGRAVLKNGVGAYRLGSRAEALDWLRNWNLYTGV